MPRAAVKKLLVSLTLIFLISCAETPRPYTRSDLANTLSKICKDEFNLSVNVWDEGETLWLYSPLDNLLDSSGNYNENIKSNLRRIMRTIGRVILNTDKKPQFYCLVASDIKNGADLYFVGHTQDRFFSRLRRPSSNELLEREAFMFFSNPNAIGDTTGTHVARHEITIGEYISFLIQQSLEKKFITDQSKGLPGTQEIKAEYTGSTLSIKINITPNAQRQLLLDSFDEARKTAKYFLKIYRPQDINEVVISNATKTNRYSVQDLLNEK